MSVTVRHLNADASFLLTFSPNPQSSDPDTTSLHTPYSVLIDPWLQGASVITYKWFARTNHVVPPCINHLSEIDEPDLVIISQNKPDHCHKETLRQLRPEGKTIIAAEPGAAKAIKGWNHFDPARVFSLPKYNPQKRFSLLRFHIPPLAPGGDPGEVTIAFLPAKNYVTGLHNGIGITYQAPTAVKTIARVCTIDLPRHDQSLDNPFSPATLPPNSPSMPLSPMQARPSTADGTFASPVAIVTDDSDMSRQTSESSGSGASFSIQDSGYLSPPWSPTSKVTLQTDATYTTPGQRPITPPDSPMESTTATALNSPSLSQVHTRDSSFSSQYKPSRLNLHPQSKTHPARPRALSILWTPHGVPLSDLYPYVQHHLLPNSALPLTLLFHAFNRATNPWYFGGNIIAGGLNGIEIARALMARVWIGAHDEEKDDHGFSVKQLRVNSYEPETIRAMLYEDNEHQKSNRSLLLPLQRKQLAKHDGEKWRKHGWSCDVRDLNVGKSMTIRAGERDLVESAAKNWQK